VNFCCGIIVWREMVLLKDSDKRIFWLMLFAFLIGLVLGILMIEDVRFSMNNQFNAKIWIYTGFLVYLFYLIGSIVYINTYFQRKNLNIYMYPLVAIVMYLPVNILAGIYFHNGVSYYSSYPRYYSILYYALFLLFLYLLARLVDYLLHSKYSKILFVFSDVLSLVAIPVLFFVTYFVSPH
jgi:hypothetical protein